MEKMLLCDKCGMGNIFRFSSEDAKNKGKQAICQICGEDVWFPIHRDGKNFAYALGQNEENRPSA